jgi:arylsulfatase A-like enzyme
VDVDTTDSQDKKPKEPSGQRWGALGDIYRATLAAKTPESIRIPLRELSDRARLDLAIGTRENFPVKFTVTIASEESSKPSAPNVVFQRTITIPNRWETASIDLAAYAHKAVQVELALSGDKKGLGGYWGSPIIRSHPGDAPSSFASDRAPGKPKLRGVIFLLIDTLRQDHLNIYGYPRETVVHLKRFAEEGAAFRHAISQATTTRISVPSMMTSLYPLAFLRFKQGLPSSAKTLAEVFHDQGYATVGYSSVGYTGLMNHMHRGYDEFHESGSVSDTEFVSKTARPYVDRLIPWLERHRDVPFFAFLHLFDPHSPYRPRPPYDTLWGDPGSRKRLAELEADMHKHDVASTFGLPDKQEYLKTGDDPNELLKIYTDWYDGSIRGADAEIGRLLEALREMGLDRDTMIVCVADHGEELWDHGRFFHGHSVYGELNQVPLIFRWPRSPDIRPGMIIDQQVQNLDIMPTILELAGIKMPKTVQGRSLVPVLNGSGLTTWQEQPAITQALVDVGPPGASQPKPLFGIVDHGWKLVRKEFASEIQEELYQHPMDGLDLTNLIKTAGAESQVRILNDKLEAWKSQVQATHLHEDESTKPEEGSEDLQRLRALGYIGGAKPASPGTNTFGNTNAVGSGAGTGEE